MLEMSAPEQTNLIKAVMTVLMSHRYKKEHECLVELDFSIVRDCLYTYSVEARERFMRVPIFAFLFHHYCSKGLNDFLESTSGRRGGSYARDLQYEMYSLHREAFYGMKRFISPTYKS